MERCGHLGPVLCEWCAQGPVEGSQGCSGRWECLPKGWSRVQRVQDQGPRLALRPLSRTSGDLEVPGSYCSQACPGESSGGTAAVRPGWGGPSSESGVGTVYQGKTGSVSPGQRNGGLQTCGLGDLPLTHMWLVDLVRPHAALGLSGGHQSVLLHPGPELDGSTAFGRPGL